MSQRRLFLDESIGESRGVVTLDGAPERLIIQRATDDPRLALGARLVARVATIEPALATAFLDLGQGLEAILPFKPDSRPVRGQSVEIELRAEPRRGKLAIARLLGPAEGDPRVLSPGPSLHDQLRAFARDGEIVGGERAREAADEAESLVLETLHPLPGGGLLAIEPTRALTAIDVDLSDRKGADSKRVTRQANIVAIAEAARLLRLKGLGGIVVMDLVGRGHDGAALMAAARAAFGPDNPGVAIGPVGRFGTMELSLPRRQRPNWERLRDPDGRLTVETMAIRLMRRLQQEAAAQGGARLTGRAAPEVVKEAQRLLPDLTAQVGSRIRLEADAAAGRERVEVVST